MPRVSIIIVSYNVKYYIEQCLRSVVVAGQDVDYEVWVVDNASTDNTVTYLKKVFPPKQFPHIHVIGNRVNLDSDVPTTRCYNIARVNMFFSSIPILF